MSGSTAGRPCARSVLEAVTLASIPSGLIRRLMKLVGAPWANVSPNEKLAASKTSRASLALLQRWRLLEHSHPGCEESGHLACCSPRHDRQDACFPHRLEACAPLMDGSPLGPPWQCARRADLMF